MSPRKTDAREKLLHAAGVLMQKQGYAATGLDQILQESQAPKGSLYHHFPDGKEQLAAEALLLTGAQYSQMIEQALQDHGLTGGFRAILTHFEQLLEQSNYTQGCPIASVASTLQPDQQTLQEACSTVFGGWLKGIEDALTQHHLPASFAPLILSSLEGALMLSRVQKSTAPLKTTGTILIQLLEDPHDQNR